MKSVCTMWFVAIPVAARFYAAAREDIAPALHKIISDSFRSGLTNIFNLK